MTRTHYIIQTSSTHFLHVQAGGNLAYEDFGAEYAAKFSYHSAQRLWRELRSKSDRAEREGGALRFPRILKVSVTMKAITPKRKKVLNEETLHS